jgi:hypothetical protein
MSRRILKGNHRYALGLAFAVAVAPTRAHAHFSLSQPPNWTAETSMGSPQKDWPCGNEDSPMATGPTTPFTAGEKITVQLTETITHAGYYRVALATSGDMMDLPQDMSMTASGTTCMNDDMQATPMMPILADGQLQHTASKPLSGVQSIEVTLPSNVSCDKCVLQVREYMQGHSNAPETPTQTNGCYYHHCAFISISAASGGAGGMGSGGAPSGGAGAGGASAGMGQGGSGVAAGMGGVMGQAGMIGMAGTPGASGSSTGGQSSGAAGGMGTSGQPGAAGMATAGAGRAASSGGAVGAGGSGAAGGTGGTSGMATSAAGGPSGMPVPETAADTGGCGCHVPSRRGSLPYGAAGVLAVGFWLARRRRA